MSAFRTVPPRPTRASTRVSIPMRTIACLALLLAAGLVALSPALAGDTPPGRWAKTGAPPLDSKLTPEQERQVRQLETLGYLAGSQPPPAATGITVHDPLRTYQGFNLYASGHGPEALFVDMNGNVLYRWRYEIQRAFPNFKPQPGPPGAQCPEYFRRARLLENGDLRAIYEGIGLIKLDKDSNLLWAYYGVPHHDFDVMPDGTIYVLTRKAWAPNGSRVIEFDPRTQRVIWYYQGTEDHPLTSHDCGSVQPLPNGNMLISESNTGRALEVTRDDQVVWEFYNPHRAGAQNEYIGALFEVVRIPPNFPLAWL